MILPQKLKLSKSLRFLLVFLIIAAVFFTPIITVAATVFVLPPVYDDTYYGVLAEKCNRLEELKEPKITVIGGSSVAFGLDSALMEEHLGMRVVNFGLYADLGTKLMMDLSRPTVKEGDIIILSPEINPQTLSLYFNGKSALMATDGRTDLKSLMDSADFSSLIGNSLSFTADKLRYLLTGTSPQSRAGYEKEFFNEYGDNVYDRPYNVMESGNPIKFDLLANFEDDITTEYEEFIEYVNEYIQYANRRGATVYFSFCPMDEDYIDPSVTEADIDAFVFNLTESLDCRVISNINTYIMDDGYFYDTEFHLNNAGVTVRTVHLIDDIKRTVGDYSITIPYDKLPAPPGYAPAPPEDAPEDDTDPNAKYFLYEEYTTRGNTYLQIVGLTEEGKGKTTLTTPTHNEGVKVKRIAKSAFAGSALKVLYLSEEINSIQGEAFRGATELSEVYLPDSAQPESVSVPNGFAEHLATDGCNPNLKIYVSSLYYEKFLGDYDWGDYGAFLVKNQKG